MFHTYHIHTSIPHHSVRLDPIDEDGQRDDALRLHLGDELVDVRLLGDHVLAVQLRGRRRGRGRKAMMTRQQAERQS